MVSAAYSGTITEVVGQRSNRADRVKPQIEDLGRVAPGSHADAEGCSKASSQWKYSRAKPTRECVKEVSYFRDQQGLKGDFLIPRPDPKVWLVETSAMQ